jgi:DNA-binding XRE family transcriptional regulator
MRYEATSEVTKKSNRTAVKNIFGAAMLTGKQMRAARGLLGWSADDLAKASKLSRGTIENAEKIEGMPNMQSKNLLAVKTALEKAGIIFIDAGDYDGRAGVGVRMRK